MSQEDNDIIFRRFNPEQNKMAEPTMSDLHDRIKATLNDESADKYGKKGHVTAMLTKVVKEITETPPAPPAPPAPPTPPVLDPEAVSLTQLIANDIKHLVVQEAFDLAESIVRVHHPDVKDDALRTETIEMMLTLNKWCRQIVP